MATIRSGRGGEGTDTVNAILGAKAFDHPKPPSLFRALVGQASSGSDIVVDFFAGAGTTAQAVLECNHADGPEGQRRFILVSNSEATEEEPNKNLCREVCAPRVSAVIAGYGQAPALGGDFAYLRCRRIEPGQMLEIEHEQVWTALQLVHRDVLLPYADFPVLISEVADNVLIYIPRFKPELTDLLREAVDGRESAVIYSWQPDTVRQHIPGGHVQHEAIPESLTRRFGLREEA